MKQSLHSPKKLQTALFSWPIRTPQQHTQAQFGATLTLKSIVPKRFKVIFLRLKGSPSMAKTPTTPKVRKAVK